MGSVLNLVYDKWDNDTPIFNGKFHYPNKHFWDIEEYLMYYVNSFVEINERFKIVRNKIKDVYQNPDKKFYYFIGHSSINILEIIENGLILSDEIINCLKDCNNFNLVFFTNHECDDEDGFVKLNNLDVDKNQIYIINNNYKLKDYILKYNSKINICSTEYLPIVVSLSLQRDLGTEFTTNNKGKFFMCFNRGPKIHRYSTLIFMYKNNLLNDTNWSFIPTNGVNYDKNYYQIFEQDEILFYQNEIDYFNNLKLKISDYEINDLEFNENNEIKIVNPRYLKALSPPDIPHNYENSYVNVVTETQFLNNKVIHITEKSIKPFFYYQFPMILSTQHHIKSLKERYDFDFFDDIIDHSYDNEYDNKIRFKKFTEELKRLHSNKESLIDFYNKNYIRFKNNKNKIIQIGKSKSDYLFIKNLL
jgi:hypothetical protein